MNTRRLPLHLVVALCAVTMAHPAAAARAVCSPDGKHIYALTAQGKSIDHIDLQAGTRTTFPVQPATTPEVARDLTIDSDGRLLLLTAKSVWSLEVPSRTWTHLFDQPLGELISIAFDPKSGAVLLLATEFGWMLWEKNGERRPVRMRRTNFEDWRHVVFDREGRLFAANRHDLWCGTIERQQEEYASLSAERCAALASFETGDWTPASVGIGEIVPAGDSLYVFLHRLGGTGIDELMRMPKPQLLKSSGNRHADTARLFQQIRILSEEHGEAFCASPDGKKLYFRQGTTYYLLEGGKKRPLKLVSR